MALSVGTKAPDFTLKSLQNGAMTDVTLSDSFGKSNTVLLFVPGAFTGVCTQEVCAISDRMDKFSALNATVYGISVDSAFAQAAWAAKEQIKFPLLSDYKHEVVEQYDVVLESLAGLGPSSKRAVFVIDKEGVIRYVQVTAVPSDLPDFDALNQAVESIA